MGDILEQLPLALTKEEDAFSKDLLLLMLKQYGLFLDSFQFACKNFKGNAGQTDIAKTIGFESNDEYNEIMFLREITHTINAFNEMADVVRLYSKKPKQQNKGLQIFYQKSYTKIPNRYSKTTGVMIYLHARSISSVPIV